MSKVSAVCKTVSLLVIKPQIIFPVCQQVLLIVAMETQIDQGVGGVCELFQA